MSSNTVLHYQAGTDMMIPMRSKNMDGKSVQCSRKMYHREKKLNHIKRKACNFLPEKNIFRGGTLDCAISGTEGIWHVETFATRETH